jgi:rRNA biogenesis protein RRP5
MMDTDVGFAWDPSQTSAKTSAAGTGSGAMDVDDDSDADEDGVSSDDESQSDDKATTHKSRRKAVAKRREEQEIRKRETELAEGVADANPQTPKDFERLIAASPNASEHWIKFMAFYLSLADVDAARRVANRAFDRIEFRKEQEKLNVWCALLAVELKFGSHSELEATVDRACMHNSPKQVYLRVCEMMEKEVKSNRNSEETVSTSTTAQAMTRADDMFAKMCKKFKGKKTVWNVYFKYLLTTERHDDAHAALKRSLKSLPAYKHLEIVSKFAQMEFEHGSYERARTLLDALLAKHPKRQDILFVYVDKEIKHGHVDAARSLLRKVSDGSIKVKLSDKQMKSVFKKWYKLEEDCGTLETREEVKRQAKKYVERSSKK